MNDKELRELADSIAFNRPTAEHAAIMAQATKHLSNLRVEVDQGRVAWKVVEGPPGLRAFQGDSKNYTVLICQFNHATDGVGHRGTLVIKGSNFPTMVMIPVDQSDYIYHKAAAVHN